MVLIVGGMILDGLVVSLRVGSHGHEEAAEAVQGGCGLHGCSGLLNVRAERERSYGGAAVSNMLLTWHATDGWVINSPKHGHCGQVPFPAIRPCPNIRKGCL